MPSSPVGSGWTSAVEGQPAGTTEDGANGVTDESDRNGDAGVESEAAQGHDRRVAQPHTGEEGPVADAEAAAAAAVAERAPLGRPGPGIDRRSPFLLGVSAAAGVAVVAAVV